MSLPTAAHSPASGSSVVAGKPAADSPSGSSGPAIVTIADTSGAPAALPTDKTVISKRPPLETPLPALATPQTLGQALVGKTIDHYELVEFVGGGGMGAVFRSIDKRLGRTVAVKILSRDHTDEETIKRFRNEAQSAARLDHPNIARVYFVGEAEGWNYIVFEFIEGTNLRDIVDARGPLPLEEALDYTLQVAEALDHASQRDVVHRDIKPSNVLVTPSGQVKLVDMGLARLHQVESSSEDLTASGVMLGTFDYISPEQARDPRSADVRSDIYSLGCTLYFMLAARPPFPEGTAVQKLLKHNSEEPPDLRLFQPGLPPAATALVSRMLAKRPSQRQQTPQDLIAEILALAHQLGLSGLSRKSSVAVTAAQPAGSIWSRLLPVLVPVAAMVLVLWLIDGLSREGARPLNVARRPDLKEPQPIATKPGEQTKNSAASDDADAAQTDRQKGTGDANLDNAGNHTPPNRAAADGPGGASTSPSIGAVNGGSKSTDTATNRNVKPGPADLRPAGGGSTGSGVPSSEPIHGESASPVPGSEKPQEYKRVIVRKNPTDPTAAADVKIAASLSEACQVATEHGISKIELEFDGPLEEQPFDVTQQRIAIAAGAGFRPVIVFRPQQFGTDRDKQMIRLVGGSRSQVTFERVELRLELPSDASAGWALLALYQIQSLDLVDSVLTVKDAGGTLGAAKHEPVAMLALQPYRPAEMMKMTDDVMAMLPSINVRLTNCVARGEATFLTAMEERPLTVDWNQGLLVTPLRLLDTGGCNLMKPNSQDKFEIILEHVTAIVPQGLVRQNRALAMPSHLRFEVTCRDSVIQWDRDAALFEFEGLASESDIKLRYSGFNNLYPLQTTFLHLKSPGGALAMDPVPLEDVSNKWGDDSSNERIRWDSDPPRLADVPAHRHEPRHYVLEAGTFSGEGFEAKLLPQFEAGSGQPRSPDGTDADSLDRPDSP
jgi:serine/threonine-protein kinase